ncbi:MAG TPA: GTP-binding protein [Puia sp.]|uniref:GTP-binding protein n=1 Tax=Puia sp. TaxID=2045100 RepID=UPI002BDEF648|nr:GTP-binding protein [Puia sp.]HVU95222.1 GTP-binding protein [Puia sp.]
MKILTLHYIMKNGRGEQLEEATTSFLHGSSALSPLLQSQLEGLQPTDKKIIALPKGAEGADDDFSFEVTLMAVRDATPAEIHAGHYLPFTKIHLLSGFLGAGKTTAIEQASQYLQKQNIPIAVITNDQGDRLVDGNRFLHLGIPSREVSGGCLCCNYNTLEENIGMLTTATRPAMVFAESVGSCTDIIATVLKPLLDRHPEWQPTISVFADAHLLDASIHDPTIRYIYQKQLEEAQILAITRSEGFPGQWKKEVRARFPGKTILFHNSYKETDIRRWLDTLESLPPRPVLPSLDIDYDIYAEGEARLAWLDQELAVDSEQAANHLMTALHDKLEKENFPVRRLKFWQTPTTLLINARVQTDRLTLMQIVADAIAEMTTLYQCDIRTINYNCFQPGYPKPQHRIA